MVREPSGAPTCLRVRHGAQRAERSDAEQRTRPVIRAPFAADIIRLRWCVPMITAAAAVNARLPYDEKTSLSDSASSLSLSLSRRYSLSLSPSLPSQSLSLAERAKGGTLERIYCYFSSLLSLTRSSQLPSKSRHWRLRLKKKKKRKRIDD